MFEQNSSFKRFMKSTPVTFVLVVLVSAMFIIQIIYSRGLVFTGTDLYRLGALFGPSIFRDNEWWRLFTVMFLHGDLFHFLFNTFFGLFIISSALERLIGSAKFAVIYFLSGLGASLLVYVVYLVTREATIGVGASGAIYGALGALLYLTIYNQDWFNPRDISSIRGLIFINVIFTVMVPGISISAHIGGLVSGFILTSILRPKRAFPGQSKGYNSPYEAYAQEIKQKEQDFDYIDIVDDDDDDDDRRVW